MSVTTLTAASPVLAPATALAASSSSSSSASSTDSHNSSSDSLSSQSSLSTIKLSPAPTITIYKPLAKHVISHHTPAADNKVPSLVRKKSGELVKSSLKLPSLLPKALSTSQLARSKSVRFASRLTNIKMFDGMESPSSVSTADNTPLDSPQYSDEYDDYEDKHRRSDYFQWGNNEANSDTSSDEDDWSIHQIPRSASATPPLLKKKEYRMLYNNVNASATYPSYLTTNSANNSNPITATSSTRPVYLASVSLVKEAGKSYLFGLINVANYGFEKEVALKLTLDNWATSIFFNGYSGTTSYHASLGPNVDQFKLKILLDDLIGNESTTDTTTSTVSTTNGFSSNVVKIQMCIKYTVNGQVYWDNNNTNNYQIHLSPVTSSGIQTYTYKPSSTTSTTTTKQQQDTKKQEKQKKEYKELVLKLKAVERDDSEPTNAAAFSLKYNFTDETSRPSLKHSYSASDIQQSRYSQSYRSKQASNHGHSKLSTTTTSTRPLSTDFSSLSYADIINKFCFSNGESTVPFSTSGSTVSSGTVSNASPASDAKVSPPYESTTPLSCSPTPASAFHSFSDSIHI
ncbi:regulatory subunit for phosphoprotein phosphatase type 1 [Scheffersomyces amazonensis]|uniref:regulatory subunit for phosphoprotein phosphatase type 1 n=1 Tax=Scheffersomyces amazonensis TaxID=1078765 RepID=UPI00315D25AC